MVLALGKTHVPANAGELRDDFLTDMRLGLIAEGVSNPPVQPDSDYYIEGTALGNLLLLAYGNIAVGEKKQNVLTATGDQLDEIRKAVGLPEVLPSAANGSIVVQVSGGGTVTIPDGTEFVLPNGKRGKVTPQHLGVANGTEVTVITIDTGSEANFGAGKIVRFSSPPTNVETEARVSASDPLTGGVDKESDDRKRDRILLRLQNPPAGGNWSHKIETALNELATVQYAFVYPALGGPSSEKVVIVKDIDPDNNDFSRAFANTAAATVRSGIHRDHASPMEIVVSAAVDETTDVGIQLTIPDSSLSGGSGTGWRDSTVWPDLLVADSGRVSVSAVGSTVQITVTANTTTSPIAGQTHVAWWSPNDMMFHSRLVTAVAGAAGAWVLTLDKPMIDTTGTQIATGEYISPDAIHMLDYGETWRTIMRNLGPGENTSDASRLPRAERHPQTDKSWGHTLTIQQLLTMKAAHDEITDAAWSYRQKSAPTVPASVATAPNILIPGNFGIYKL